MKKALVVFGSVIVGNYLTERFVLKASAEDTTGFIQVADGFGWDDVARAATVLLTVYAADALTKKLVR